MGFANQQLHTSSDSFASLHPTGCLVARSLGTAPPNTAMWRHQHGPRVTWLGRVPDVTCLAFFNVVKTMP